MAKPLRVVIKRASWVALFVLLVITAPAAADEPMPKWMERFPRGGPSSDIIQHGAYAGYDASSNRLIVFFPGAPTQSNPTLASEVWVITNANGVSGRSAWRQLQPTGAPPVLNGEASVTYDPFSNLLIVYGGCPSPCTLGSATLDSVFLLSHANGLGGTPAWSTLSVTNPQGRMDHSAVYDPDSNLIIAFGGAASADFGADQNDVRVLSNANGAMSPSTWSALSPSGALPGKREQHTAIYDRANNRMTIFGGTVLIQLCCPDDLDQYNDTWVLSSANGQGGVPSWTRLATTGGLPSERGRHSAVYDTANQRMIVFGGVRLSAGLPHVTPLGDVWQLSKANGLGGDPVWTEVIPSGVSPGPNYRHGAAFDVATQRMMVVGGINGTAESGTFHSRVWLLDFGCSSPTITGTPGSDVIHGTPGDDVIDGLGGDDEVFGEGGDDLICGNDGHDTLHGGPGSDMLVGGRGRDILFGDDGNDILQGNAGNDQLDGGEGRDILDGGKGDDTLSGSSGKDSLTGGDGFDTCDGGEGKNSIKSCEAP